jgi:hypothetical protein
VLIPGTATNLENVSARLAGHVKVEHTLFGHASNREGFFLPTDGRDSSRDPILRFYLVTKGPRNSMVVE